MPGELRISIGQFSSKGRKDENQDFYGVLTPSQPALGLKGVAVAIADGIGSSAVGGVASESAVASFLADYYCTPDSWSAKTSAQRVIAATNSWLHAETRRAGAGCDRDRGYVTTLDVLILKSRSAHVFHVGDSRICRLAGRSLERLTEDHRVVLSGRSYLGRALGANPNVEIDHRVARIETGDVFVLTTDGVHDHLRDEAIASVVAASPVDLAAAARCIVEAAYDAGSDDNLTVQIIRIDELPDGEPADLFGVLDDLVPAPPLEPPTTFDGYRVLRPLHESSRSHVYLAIEPDGGERVALKVPSVDLGGDRAYLRRFMMEEWIARRIDSPHVLKARPRARPRSRLYLVMDYVEGQTLAQWMADNPAPSLEAVRRIVEQIAKGAQAFHRKEMIHQDLRPQNVLIDASGTVRIIDFGSTKVAGVSEIERADGLDEMLGTLQYAAPECLAGGASSDRSDIFSVGVIAYQMLTGSLPYGPAAARARVPASQRRLRYALARQMRPEIPAFVDGAMRKAVAIDPRKRYEALSEFMHDLRRPNAALGEGRRAPLLESNPVAFWRSLALLLALAVVLLLAERAF